MKKLVLSVFIMVLTGVVLALSPVWGQDKNLSVNAEVTATIRAFDQAFFQEFDVYFAGASTEVPTALLFDIKDDYHLPARSWGKPLNEEEIIYAIRRMDDQYIDPKWDIPFEPRALNVINVKGEVLGYCYTGLTYVRMDRKKDGRVIVYRPEAHHYDGGNTDGAPLP
jgi:hypothetical protein